MNSVKPLFWTFVANKPVIALVTLLATAPALADYLPQVDFCKSLSREKSSRAFLFDETGKQLLTHFDLGHLDVVTDGKSDFIVAPRKFRLVFYPKRLILENFSSQTVYLIDKKVKARCTLTSEYLVQVGFSASALKLGKFDREAGFLARDPKLLPPEDVNGISRTYEDRVSGSISIPAIELVESTHLQTALKLFFGSGNKNIVITLENTGDRPLHFGAWEKADHQQEQEITIQKNTCVNILLEPSGRCEITISKTSENALSKDFYYWASMPRVGNFMLPVILDIQKLGNSEVEVSVRNR